MIIGKENANTKKIERGVFNLRGGFKFTVKVCASGIVFAWNLKSAVVFTIQITS